MFSSTDLVVLLLGGWSSEGKVQTPPANAGRGPAGPGLVSFLSDPMFSHSCSLSPTSSPSPPTSGPTKL